MSLRIAVCAKRDLLGAMALNELLPGLASHRIALFYSNKTRPVERAVPDLAAEALLERDLPLEVLFPLLAQLPPDGRCATFAELAQRHGCAETVLTDVRPDGWARDLHEFAPDLIISVRFSLIFMAPTIAAVRHGIINVHPGPLPQYRGLFAPFWQMLHQQTRLGVTTHMVDAGIDTGPILGIDWVPVTEGRSVFWHLPLLYGAGVRRALSAVGHLVAGTPLAAVPQPSGAGDYYRFPTAADIAELRASGRELVLARDYTECLRRMAGLPGQDAQPT